MAVKVTGMFGTGKTYFSGSPVVIDISGLEWNSSSPFDIVRINVLDASGNAVGDFHADTGGQVAISFDIQSALRSIWADYDFASEVSAAAAALAATSASSHSTSRAYKDYSIQLSTEYLDSTDNEFTTTASQTFTGGRCMIGALTEWERYNITNKEDADASHWEHTNLRNGDASTKPTKSPERVGKSSLTSWVDVNSDGTTSVFFPPVASPADDSTVQHPPRAARRYRLSGLPFYQPSWSRRDCERTNERGSEHQRGNKTIQPGRAPNVQAVALIAIHSLGWQAILGDVERIREPRMGGMVDRRISAEPTPLDAFRSDIRARYRRAG